MKSNLCFIKIISIVTAFLVGNVSYSAIVPSLKEATGTDIMVIATDRDMVPFEVTLLKIIPKSFSGALKGSVTTDNSIAMTAPTMVIDPLEIHVVNPFGTIVTRTITVSNTGDGTLDWSAVVSTDHKRKVSIPAGDGKFPHGTAPVSIGRAPVGKSMTSKPLTGKGALGYAFDIYPGNTFFSFDTYDPATQNVISSIDYMPVGGSFDATHADHIYIIDYNTNKLRRVDVATGYVTDIGICNPFGDELWTGIKIDRTSDIMYGMSSNLSQSTLYTIDKFTGIPTVIGPTGIPGAIDLVIDGTGQMYSYDIVNDQSYRIDKATGVPALLGSIGFDANYAQGMAWDPGSDIIYLAAYNSAYMRGELRILDPETGNSAFVGEMGGQIDALVFPGGCCTWLSIDKDSGTLQPGAIDTVTVTLDGTYVPSRDIGHGTITFSSDPDVGIVEVPVTMTQFELYGKLEGFVTHGGIGVPNAIVTANGTEPLSYTDTTNNGGHYLISDMVPGTYDVIVEVPGFNPYYTSGVIISPEETTTLNIYLTAPVLSVTPDELTVTLPSGQHTQRWLLISNAGDGMLEVRCSAHQNKKQVVSIPTSNGYFPRGTAAHSFERAPVGDPVEKKEFNTIGRSLGYAFEIYPDNTFFSFNTDDPGSYTIINTIDYLPSGGTFDAVNTDFMYVIEYNTNTLIKVDVATGATMTVGTCTPYGNQSWTGITVDKTTNTMYGISTDLNESYLYTIDMATGASTVISPTGIPGAIDVTVDGNGQMYSFDIVGDNAYLINKETAASTLIGSIGFDANYAQGMGWDPNSDIVCLAAYNNSTQSGELRILDRVTGNTTLVGVMGGEIDGLAFLAGEAPQWLYFGPGTFIVPPANSVQVNVNFYAEELEPGTYTGYLTLETDPDVGTVNIPVTLIVSSGPTLSIGKETNIPAGPVWVPVHAEGITNMGSFQFTIDYNPDHLTYTGTSNWYPGTSDVLVGNPGDGKLTFVWTATSEGVTIVDDNFFYMIFSFSGTLEYASVTWSDNPIQREFADYNGNIFVPVYNDGWITGESIGIPENESKVIRVYPNPASDVITLKSDYIIENIEVLSYLGQPVLTGQTHGDKEVQLNVSSLPSGIYFVKVHTGHGIMTTKIGVKH